MTICLLILISTLTNAQISDKIRVTDMLHIKSVNGVSLNPAGTMAAFTVTSIEADTDVKGEYKYINQIWVVPVNGSAPPRQFTFGKESAAQPVFSPDGKSIAFVRASEGKPQLFLLSLEGGEAVQLTHFKYGASNPKWAPNGKQLIFSAGISLKELLRDSVLNPTQSIPKWAFEKPGFDQNERLIMHTEKPNPDGSLNEIRAYLDQNETEHKAKVLTRLQFQEESTTSNEISFTHFFITEAQPGSQVKELTHGFYRYSSVEMSADGNHLYIAGSMDSSLHPDRVLESQLYTANGDGTNLHLLLGAKGKAYTGIKLSHNGQLLAFQSSNTGFAEIPQLSVIQVKEGSGNQVLTEYPLDRAAGNLLWSKDNKYLYVAAQSHGGAPLYRIDVKSKKILQLSDDNAGISSADLKGNTLVYSKTEVADPFELYAGDTLMKHSIRLSQLNTEWLQGKTLSYPEKHSFTNEKGQPVDYWVMKPLHYKEGQKYPLLLDIHGGPSAMWGPGESSMWHEFQYFCAQGYGVVYSNPRGSGGYGTAFLQANINDWGDGPTRDVLTALDKTVAEGWADTSKLLVSGGSYAGYLVSWIIGHDHRFKAACSQRGVYDLSTFFGEGNAWRLVPNYFGGYPWQADVKKLLDYESPITYVQNITTPYLIFHGENDLRTGTIQGEMLFKSLKVLGRPVEYVRHPGATHEITRTGNNRQRIDQRLRTYEFFERYLQMAK